MRSLTDWLVQFFRRPKMRYAFAPARRLCLMLTLVFGVSGTASAQLSQTLVNSIGLEQMWQTQLQMPLRTGKVVSADFWTDPNQERVYAELTWPVGTPADVLALGKKMRVSADRLGDDGKPIGIERAKQELETRAMRLLRRPSGLTAAEVKVPIIYLITTTSDGIVQAFDAETGEQLWTNNCAAYGFPAMPASVGSQGVSVMQGQYLHLFDLATGKELIRRKMERATSTGVALANGRAFLSAYSGQVIAIDFQLPATARPWTYRLYGKTLIAPATSDPSRNLVAFGTSSGIVTVFSSEKTIEPWFNFEARNQLAGPLTFIGDSLFVCDISGQLTKIGLERVGKVRWKFMLGSSLSAPPMLVDKTLYVANDVGQLFAADNETGKLVWGPTPRIKSILTATQSRLYCRSLTDRLMVLDRATGEILEQTESSVIGMDVINHLTDRVVLISSTGRMQSLREPGRVDPTFLTPLPKPAEKPSKPQEAGAAAAATAEPGMEPAAADAAADPFGTGGSAAPDAFGAPATPPAGGAADPFATPPGANPF